MTITHNPRDLSAGEVAYLLRQAWFHYIYGSGLILLSSGGSWGCSNTVAAKTWLDERGIVERK